MEEDSDYMLHLTREGDQICFHIDETLIYVEIRDCIAVRDFLDKEIEDWLDS